MAKILLIYDDYTELMAAENVMRKAGFDVISLSSEVSISEKIIGFNPDLVVCQGKSARVSSFSVGKKLKEMTRWKGKAILGFLPQAKPSAQDILSIRVDMIMESPMEAIQVVKIGIQLLELGEQAILDKLERQGASDAVTEAEQSLNSFRTKDEDHIPVFGDVGVDEIQQGPYPSVKQAESSQLDSTKDRKVQSVQDELIHIREKEHERIVKYQDFIKNISINAKQSLKRVETRRRQKEISAEWDREKISHLDHLRKAFVKAMFKK